MTQALWWYSVRASGLVAWALVTATVVWGLVLSSRTTRRPRPAWVLDLHRFLALLTWVFLAAHLVGLTFDAWVGFGPRELALPMASRYRPGAVAWGIVATYVLAAVHITSILMARLPRRLWHLIHLGSFVVFAFTTVHVLTAGTDSARLPTRVFAVASCALVVVLVVVRIAARVMAGRRTAGAPRAGHVPWPRAHDGAPARTLRPVDEAIGEVVSRGDRRDRTVARHGNHRRGVSRGTPR